MRLVSHPHGICPRPCCLSQWGLPHAWAEPGRMLRRRDCRDVPGTDVSRRESPRSRYNADHRMISGIGSGRRRPTVPADRSVITLRFASDLASS
jgi:hypothetical protein